MDFSKFNALSTDTLRQLQEHIQGVLKTRLDTRPLPGRVATFKDRVGNEHVVTIDRVNRTTCSCIEITPVRGHRWKVGMSLLQVQGIERQTPLKSSVPHAPHRPASIGDAW